jgi:gentisate 1,2-dioxygenase
VGDERLEWEQGDSFVAPLWMWHAHENTTRQPAILFSINDRPVMEALGLYREDND